MKRSWIVAIGLCVLLAASAVWVHLYLALPKLSDGDIIVTHAGRRYLVEMKDLGPIQVQPKIISDYGAEVAYNHLVGKIQRVIPKRINPKQTNPEWIGHYALYHQSLVSALGIPEF